VVRLVARAEGGSDRVAERYDYDARGNWIKKVVEAHNGAAQDFAVSIIEQRTLAYDD